MNGLSIPREPRRRGAFPRLLVPAGAAASLLLLVAACGVGGGDGDIGNVPPTPYDGALFHVCDTSTAPVGGARVYLVPVADVDQAAFTGADVLGPGAASESRDEPLEDAVALKGAGYPQAVTNLEGKATVSGIPPGRYFTFVQPAAADVERLPGGTGGRTGREAISLLGDVNTIVLSTRPPVTATYTGTTACLTCHAEYATQKTHAHRLGFAVPGQVGPLQDFSRYPDFTRNWDLFLPAATYAGGTVIWCYDYDPSRGFDKFKTLRADPTITDPLAVVYVKAYLWKDGAGTFKITLENVHPGAGVPGPGDPPNPWTLDVDLTYGGAVYKQRNLVRLPGRNGRYPLFQFQTQGQDGRYDRTRKSIRDYHLDWYWDDGLKLFKLPDVTRAFEGNCTGCHSTGFERYQDPVTSEFLSRAVADPGGVIDIDGNGSTDEINTGCEVCHGPGSAHAAWAGDPANAGRAARYIVRPDCLSPSREMMICGRCHDRPLGAGSRVTEEPLNGADEMAPPGISRREFLAAYTSRKGPAASDYWSDDLHSKSHHQQYSDLLKSRKHRNARLLVVCSDCHGSHGDGAFRNHLKADPDDGVTGLCFQCHGTEILGHMVEKTGATHAGPGTACVRCHMPETAKSGAGVYGIILPGGTTGTPVDLTKSYFRNDIASHLFGSFARRTHPDVKGVLPGFAMPIPFTNGCGTGCHDVAPLQLPKPGLIPGVVWPLEGPFAREADDYAAENGSQK